MHLVRHTDMSNVGVPDEKAVILFITYLCARLMHLNKDIRVRRMILPEANSVELCEGGLHMWFAHYDQLLFIGCQDNSTHVA